MKAITPVSIWTGGQTKTANNLELAIVHDNLESSATFYWQLLSVTTDADGNTNSEQLAQGNLTIDGPDYENWGSAQDVNDEAFSWAAGQLNLQLS
jgi:hypothetical protein